jgi:hypothetical protein
MTVVIKVRMFIQGNLSTIDNELMIRHFLRGKFSMSSSPEDDGF